MDWVVEIVFCRQMVEQIIFRIGRIVRVLLMLTSPIGGMRVRRRTRRYLRKFAQYRQSYHRYDRRMLLACIGSGIKGFRCGPYYRYRKSARFRTVLNFLRTNIGRP